MWCGASAKICCFALPRAWRCPLMHAAVGFFFPPLKRETGVCTTWDFRLGTWCLCSGHIPARYAALVYRTPFFFFSESCYIQRRSKCHTATPRGVLVGIGAVNYMERWAILGLRHRLREVIKGRKMSICFALRYAIIYICRINRVLYFTVKMSLHGCLLSPKRCLILFGVIWVCSEFLDGGLTRQ